LSTEVVLPLWLVLLGGVLAAWAALDRLLLPTVRWYLQRRANVVIEELNRRLALEIPEFKRTERRVLVERLVFDPKVLEAMEAEARATGVPREVVLARVKRYAKEIVPAFSARMYFSVGNTLARGFVRTLYRVRLGYADESGLKALPPRTSIVFVMNHRSNMDYILAAYLALERTALSYAVGEWARVWPIQQLVRLMGGFFVRRNSGDPLYRKVLERYVQMATEGGVVQAMFPEGGLSRDGRLRAPKIGLLDYMLRGFDPAGPRDLVFIPVGINYDRVLEDRTLLLDATPDAHPDAARRERKSGMAALGTVFRFIGRNLGQMLVGRWYRFGYACANFGSPFSTRDWLIARRIDLKALDRDARGRVSAELMDDLMREVGKVVPVLPVSLVAHTLLGHDGPLSRLELKARVQALVDALDAQGAKVYIPRSDREYAIEVGLRMLTLRRIVIEADGMLAIAPGERALVAYYANAIAHLV
jgi:glycerol-3-phosphate O-acyltransferase